MDNQEETGTLALFTAVAPLAVGGLIGLLALTPAGQRRAIDPAALLVWIVGLVALGISLLHLGRPWRAPLAILRLSTSWLSREVFFFALFLLFAAVYMLLPLVSTGAALRTAFGVCAALIGLIATVASGETYHLRSHPSWNQAWSVIAFPLGALSCGILFGFWIASIFPRQFEPSPATWAIVGIFLVAAGVVSLIRSLRLSGKSQAAVQSRRQTWGPYLWLIIIRLAGILLALGFIAAGGTLRAIAWMPAFFGELADRFLFFNSAVPESLRSRYL